MRAVKRKDNLYLFREHSVIAHALSLRCPFFVFTFASIYTWELPMFFLLLDHCTANWRTQELSALPRGTLSTVIKPASMFYYLLHLPRFSRISSSCHRAACAVL